LQISGLNKLTIIFSQKIKNLSYNPLNNAASPLVKKSQKRLYFVAIDIKRIRLSAASFSRICIDKKRLYSMQDQHRV
jgi:hypothetical protein